MITLNIFTENEKKILRREISQIPAYIISQYSKVLKFGIKIVSAPP